TAEITKESLYNAFNQIPVNYGFVLLPYDTSDGLLKLNWEEHPHDDNYFMQTAHIFETRDQANIDLFSGVRTEQNQDFFDNFFKTLGGKPKPCVSGSDAHKYSDYGNYPSDKITWIKADPTFEGLKQIIFEPLERVKISKDNPNLEYDKPYFSKITISENLNIFADEDDISFAKDEGIPLNQNLVAIIGGRGEGKSMLTDYIASSFIDQKHSKEGTFNKSGEVQLSYYKSNQSDEDVIDFSLTEDKKAVDFIYISQGSLKNLVEKKDNQFQLANSIRKLAKLKEPEFDSELDNKVRDSINEFHGLQQFFSVQNDEGNYVNSVEHLQVIEKSIQAFISNITTSENKEKLEKFSHNLRKRNELNLKLNDLDNLEKEIEVLSENINEIINSVNGDTTKIPLVELSAFQNQIMEIDNWKTEIRNEIEQISNTVSEVREEFKDYKGDLTTLLGDINKFQNKLTEVRELIATSKAKYEKKERLKNLIFIGTDDSISLVDQIKQDFELQASKLTDDWNLFKDVDSKEDLNPSQKDIMKNLLTDLEIDVKVDFDLDSFYNDLYHCIDGAKWRIKGNRTAQIESFGITDMDSFIDFLKNRYLEFYSSDGVHSDELKKLLFKQSERRKYIQVYPILKYKGKDLNKISVGQKGTVYLKMMLATEAFSKPIIFDQPEDDLDNEFIMQNLISLFKELKQYRQVIIVTHNANLVVNADAEQVIVASNIDGKLSYSSGSLEDNTINTKICKILEGGELAFEKRRSKYQEIE
ncbi:MAG: TrlF family AAA-like ATPase, partial [Balneola sp.]